MPVSCLEVFFGKFSYSPFSFSVHFFFKFIYFERHRVSASGGRAKREGERESQAGSVLSARGSMWGSSPQNCEIVTWAETKSRTPKWLSHPGALLWPFLSWMVWGFLWLSLWFHCVFWILTANVWFTKLSSILHIVFAFRWWFFAVQKLFSLVLSHLLIFFPFVVCAFGVIKQNRCQTHVEQLLPCFLLGILEYQVLCLNLRHFELLFVSGVRRRPYFMLLPVLIQFSHVLSRPPFPSCMFLAPYQILVDCICQVYFWSLFCSIGLCAYFYASTTLF